MSMSTTRPGNERFEMIVSEIRDMKLSQVSSEKIFAYLAGIESAHNHPNLFSCIGDDGNTKIVVMTKEKGKVEFEVTSIIDAFSYYMDCLEDIGYDV